MKSEKNTTKEIEIRVFERVVKKDDKTYKFKIANIDGKYYDVRLFTSIRPNFSPFIVSTNEFEIVESDDERHNDVINISGGEFSAPYYDCTTNEEIKG